MLKKRVCIGLMINDGVLFRTKNFVPDYRYTMNFVGTDAVDEVFLIDITRSGPSEASLKTMKAYADQCFTPVTMGGHIKSLDDVKKYMEIGADKVVIGRHAEVFPCAAPYIGEQIAKKYGSQAFTASIDVGLRSPGISSGCSPGLYAKMMEINGAGEIFLQSVERDGSLGGYDIETLKSVVAAVKIPVVVGCGCGSWAHMKEAFDAGADGAVTTVIHHFTEAALKGFKKNLTEAGCNVRP